MTSNHKIHKSTLFAILFLFPGIFQFSCCSGGQENSQLKFELKRSNICIRDPFIYANADDQLYRFLGKQWSSFQFLYFLTEQILRTISFIKVSI